MNRKTILKSLSMCGLLFCSSSAFAEDDVTTRTLKGVGDAEGARVSINQIDTSAFPKVTIFASVLKAGEPVLGLTSSDFQVREDEVDQEPLTVVPKLTPLAVTVTFDTSGSMKQALSTAKSAALSFIDTLSAEDEVLAMGFAREVRVLAPLSTNKGAAKSAIEETAARGDTALYDALYASVDALKNVKGRKAIILLSDGVDDDGYGKQLSKRNVSEAIELARKVNVPIFTIGLGNSLDETTLTAVAKESGAAYYHAPNAAALKGLYDNIGKQLAGQYNIYYTSNLPGDGSVHRVQLSHDTFKSVKEYLSPSLTAPPVAAVAAATPAQEASPTSRKVSVFHLGKFNAPNISKEDITIYSHKTEKWAGNLTSKKRQLELPPGDYILKMASVTLGPITLAAGDTKDIKTGRIVATSLMIGDEIGVRLDEKEEWAGNLNLKRNDGILEVFPGNYRLKLGNCLSAPVTVVEGQDSTVQLGRVEVPNLIDDVDVITSPKSNWCGHVKKDRTSMPVFPGEFTLKIKNCVSKPFTLAPGATFRQTLGFVSMTGASSDFGVAPAESEDWCGTISKKESVLQVFPGSYRLRSKNHFSEPFAVAEGETVEAN